MESYDISSFTNVLDEDEDVIPDSQPISLSPAISWENKNEPNTIESVPREIVVKRAGQRGELRSIEEIDPKYRSVFNHQYFNLVQSNVIDDALYSDNSLVLCAPTGSGKTVVFEMAIVRLLMQLEKQNCSDDFKIIYMAPVKALCTERLTEWYPKFTKLGLMCIEVTGDTNVDFGQLNPYRLIITTPEKWDMLTRRWRDHRNLVEVVKLFLIDEVHILNDESRGPVLEAVVSRMKTIESSAQSVYRKPPDLQHSDIGQPATKQSAPSIRFVAISATVSNPEDVASWLSSGDKPAIHHKFDSSCRPVALRTVVEGVPDRGASGFKFDMALNYRLWPIINKYYNGKPTLIFCNTRKSVTLTAETLCRELTVNFGGEQKQRLAALAANIKNKKLQTLIVNGVGCHHAGLPYEERLAVECAFRNRDLPILITTTTLAMGVNLPAHLVIIKNTQQYVNGGYQEYSISTVLQMVGRAGRPQFDTDATAVIITRAQDKHRYETLVSGEEPLQSYLHKRLAENLNSEIALGAVSDVAQCVHWLDSTFLHVRAARDPRRYLGLPPGAPAYQISKKLEELCVIAVNGLVRSGLITMDDATCIQSTEAGRLMSVYYLDFETMKLIMKVKGTEGVPELLSVVCASHELCDMHLRMGERRVLNALNRNAAAPTVRYPIKGKITTRQSKLYCWCQAKQLQRNARASEGERLVLNDTTQTCRRRLGPDFKHISSIIQAVLGCLPIPDAALNQEAMKIMRIAERICKCLVSYVTRPEIVSQQSECFAAVVSSVTLAKCVDAHLWEDSPFVSKQLRGIGPAFSARLASAGKVNFMLLEESHPRDLERIMNKGPPAGNVLRKQISLLPKYQITITPKDEKNVNMQITLMNRAYLAENIDQLTAGENHKSYVIVGDSSNHLLLYTCFRDKDLIRCNDGIISREITRINAAEHKLFAHVISSSFVGIDARCEYLFKDIQQHNTKTGTSNDNNIAPTPKVTKKQTYITDLFKGRKRRNNFNNISQSKEKRKRENALIEKFQAFNNSLNITSKEIKHNLNQTVDMSQQISQNLGQKNNFAVVTMENSRQNEEDCEISTRSHDFNLTSIQNIKDMEINDSDGSMDNDRIANILNDIEREMNNTNFNKKSLNSKRNETLAHFNKSTQKRNKKSNYSFIDELEQKNSNLSREEKNVSEEGTGFTETVKDKLGKFFQEKEHNNMVNVDDIATNQTINEIESIFLENNIKPYEFITKNHTGRLQENKNVLKMHHKATYKNEDKNIDTNNSNHSDSLERYQRNAKVESTYNDTRNVGMIDSPAIEINNYIPNKNITALMKMDDNIPNEGSYTEIYSKTDSLDNFGTKSLQKSIDIPKNVSLDAMNTNTEVSQVINVNSDFKPLIESKTDNSNTHFIIIDADARICSKNNSMATYGNICLQKSTGIVEDVVNVDFVNTNTKVSQTMNESNVYKQSTETNSFSTVDYKKNIDSHNSECTEQANPRDVVNNEVKNKKQFITEYSLSKTKINVHTENILNHNIHITRKIKVDMNITKIVSQNSTKYYNPINMDKDEQIIDTRKGFVHSKFSKDKVVQLQEADLNDVLYNKNIDNDQCSEKENKNQDMVKDILEKYRTIFRNNHQESINKNANSRIVITKENKAIKTIPKRAFNITDLNRIDAPLLERFQIGTDKNRPVIGANTIANSSMQTQKLGHASTKEDIQISKFPEDELDVQINGIKQNRPFKISDLNQVDSPVSERFKIEADKNKPVMGFSKISNMQFKNPEHASPNQAIQISTFPNDELTVDQLDNINMKFSEPHPNIDFKMDPVMLNPKALLQSMTDDTCPIIPPPPQFTDLQRSSTYSPVPVEFTSSNKDVTYMNNDLIKQDLSDTEVYDNLTLSNSYDIDLTRSEVETWNLEIEDNSYQPITHYGHNNLPSSVPNNKNKQNSGYIVPGKLSQYQFEQKSKLKFT